MKKFSVKGTKLLFFERPEAMSAIFEVKAETVEQAQVEAVERVWDNLLANLDILEKLGYSKNDGDLKQWVMDNFVFHIDLMEE